MTCVVAVPIKQEDSEQLRGFVVVIEVPECWYYRQPPLDQWNGKELRLSATLGLPLLVQAEKDSVAVEREHLAERLLELDLRSLRPR
jgi:hypothetical protein